jgi:hypothetical protein
MKEVTEILASMRGRGITLTLVNGTLRYVAPKGALGSDEIATLRALKAQIVSVMKNLPEAAADELALIPRQANGRVPFTFAQQWYWDNIFPLGSARNVRFWRMRVCAVALRIIGPLNVQCLRDSVAALVRHHEVLRTRIVTVDDVFMQEGDDARGSVTEFFDLSGTPAAAAQAEAKRLVEEFVYAPVGPLFGARLLQLGPAEHVFVTGMSHLIADAASVDILRRDLFSLYSQGVSGAPLALPAVPVQYADYAAWQYESRHWWEKNHGAYWQQRFRGARHVKCPLDAGLTGGSTFKSVRLPIEFDRNLIAGLRKLSHRARTTLPMTVLAAYAAAIIRWQADSELVVRLMVNGRNRPELENMIGLVASWLCLRVQLQESHTFLDLLRQVTDECNAAQRHYDFGRMSVAGPGFGMSVAMNWITVAGGNGSASPGSGVDEAVGAVRVEPFPFGSFGSREFEFAAASPQYNPILNLFETGDVVRGDVLYRTDMFRPGTMECLGRNLHGFMQQFLERPQTPVAAVCYQS